MNEQTPTCRRAEVLINRRLDRECTHGESTELDQHLSSCPECRAEYNSARGLEALFAQLAVPDSSAARDRFKARMGELIREKPASKPVTHLKLRAARPKVWLSALAALLAVALVGAVAILIQKDSTAPEVALLSVKFDDRIAILETLSERTLQAASQTPGTELARTHEQLATDLAAVVVFESQDAATRDEAASSYIRTHTLALFPELQEGLLGKDRLPNFRSRRQALNTAKPATSTLSLATAVSAYAVEFLEGRTTAQPPFTTPKAGASLQSAFSDATIAMRETAQPLDRAQILDQVAERVLNEASRDTLSPADSARLQNVAAVLSSRGTQNQLRLAARDARTGDEQRVASLLKSDALRLEKLQSLAEKLPPQQQESVMGILAVTRASNRKMQETLTPPVEQKTPAPQNIQPPAKPVDPLPQKTTDAVVPAPNLVPAVVPNIAPAGIPAAIAPVALPPAIVVPSNTGIAPAPGSETGKKNDTIGKENAPGQSKDAPNGKDTAPGQIKKSDGDENPGNKVPPGQSLNNDPAAKSNGKGTEKFEAASSRGGPPEKVDRPEAIDRPEKPERPERPERPENIDRPERPEKVERADKPDRGSVEKPERAERPDKPEKPERPERPDVPEKPDRPDKPDKPDTPGNGGNGNGNGNGGTDTGGGNGNGGTNPGGGNGNGGGGNNPNKPEKPEKPPKK